MAQNQPNLVIIHSHDLGQHLGCYGVPTVRSPRIDALAEEGVRFANSFCTAPQCSPSRASIFTGRFPHSNGVMGLCHADFAWDLHENERHLASLLRDAGYHTTLVGVCHETRRPGEMGFDQIVGGAAAPKLGEIAVEQIDSHADAGDPFYMQIGFFEPHRAYVDFGYAPDTASGITVPDFLADEISSRKEFAYYQGAIHALDAAVGRILDALDENNLADNTIVVFTADHGMPFPRAKCSVYDPGLQVALIVRWPGGGVRGGQVQEPMISNVDYVPTLLELLGVARPADAPPLQGRSFAPLLTGGEYESRAEIFGEMTFHDYCDPRRFIRTRTHKLIANFSTAPFFMDPSQSWQRGTITKTPDNPPYAYHPPVELYDLEADPLETNNLVESDEHVGLLGDLLRRLHRWMVETEDPLLAGIPNSPMHRMVTASLAEGRVVRIDEAKQLAGGRTTAASSPTTLVFAYSADAGLLRRLSGAARKLFGPRAVPCRLLELTRAPGEAGQNWQSFVASLPWPAVFHHRNELIDGLVPREAPLPAVFLDRGRGLELWIDAETIAGLESVEQLQDLITRKIGVPASAR